MTDLGPRVVIVQTPDRPPAGSSPARRPAGPDRTYTAVVLSLLTGSVTMACYDLLLLVGHAG